MNLFCTRAPQIVAALALAFWLVYLAALVAIRHGGDPRALVCLGEKFFHPPAFAEIARTSPHGYDGQHYAALATDPLLRDPETARALDDPFYRGTRIAVPMAAFVASLGQPGIAVFTYQLLIWALGLAAVYLVAAWLKAEGGSPWWALLLVVSGGLATSFVRSTVDAAALGLLLLALWCHRQGKLRLALALIVAATLARETSWLAALAIALAELRERRFRRAAAFALAPLAATGLWMGYLELVLPPHHHGIGVFGTPLLWLGRKWAALGATGAPVNRMEVFGLVAIAASLVSLAIVLARFRRWTPVEGAFAAFGLLGVFFSYDVYVEAYAYARVLIALPFLAILIAEREEIRWRRWILRTVTIAYALVGWTVIRGELSPTTALNAVARVLRGGSLAASAGAPRLVAPPMAAVAPHPSPTPEVRAVGPARYLLPVANVKGHEGAQWQSELELGNPSPVAAQVAIELLAADRDNQKPPSRALALSPGERLVVGNSLQDLFGASGAGALRLLVSNPALTATLRTRNVAAAAPQAPPLPAIPENEAFGPGAEARLTGLASERSAQSWVRTNLALLNVSLVPTEVQIDILDEQGATLGLLSHTLRPRDFHQITDIFLTAQAPRVVRGSVVLRTTTTGGAFLACASVIRKQSSEITYLLPRRRAATR
ncbi:MAG: hypothetical protein V1750_09345 [Acidobacteriota bacterium]